MKTAILTVALLVAVSIQLTLGHHNNGTCSVPGDCHDGECCVYQSEAKFVLPTCQKMGEVGDTCRPNHQPEDLSLTIRPGKEPLKVKQAYRALCPCLPTLNCNKVGQCEQKP